MVFLEVGDTGVGMDEETRRRCLEPFFTTKGERGTGMGLAMVYGMTQRHGAQIEIDSAPGRGTTVRLLFPAAPLSVDETGRQLALGLPLRPLRMLIIDDDPLIIESLRETLRADGHRVTVAEAARPASMPSKRHGRPASRSSWSSRIWECRTSMAGEWLLR